MWPGVNHSSRTGRVCFISDAVCTGGGLAGGVFRGVGPSETRKRGAKQRTVVLETCTNSRSQMPREFLGLNLPFSGPEDACPPPSKSCSPSQKPSLKVVSAFSYRPWPRATRSPRWARDEAGRPRAAMEDLPISAEGPRTGTTRRDNLRERRAVMQKRDDRPASAALVSSAGLEHPLPPRTWTVRA